MVIEDEDTANYDAKIDVSHPSDADPFYHPDQLAEMNDDDLENMIDLGLPN